MLNLKFSEIESLKKAKVNIANNIKKAKITLNKINSLDPNKLKEVIYCFFFSLTAVALFSFNSVCIG